MTMFGASWGLRLSGVTPIAKLVAINLGDFCDQDGRGIAHLDELAEWACVTEALVVEALKVLEASAGVDWSLKVREVRYQLPDAALPPQRSVRDVEKKLFLYVITGRLGTKVGITQDVEQRVLGLRLATLDNAVAAQWSARDTASVIRLAERRAHALLAEKLIRNEWFSVSPAEAITAAAAALASAKQDRGKPDSA